MQHPTYWHMSAGCEKYQMSVSASLLLNACCDAHYIKVERHRGLFRTTWIRLTI